MRENGKSLMVNVLQNINHYVSVSIFKRSFAVLVVLLLLFPAVTFSATWYPLVSGDWDDPEIWTLDPSGALPNNPDSLTPGAGDYVVILTGRYITVNTDNKEVASITVFGELDMTTTSGHNFTEIKGGGIIYMADDNFPVGDATHFITDGQGEGTVVYYGSGHTLSIARTFYNMKVNLDNAADVLTLTADYTLNGSLTITNGTLQINDNSSTTALDILISGDVTLESGGSFTTGTGNAIHTVEFRGNITNNGTIDFANDAQYDVADDGGVIALFSGASNNTLTCNGTTDLHRLILNKGTDESYILSVLSTNTANFRLFGPVAGNTAPYDSGLEGWENLALVLYNGTLKLGANIDIPVLGANRSGTDEPYEFHIPYGARLWIDGADVSTHTSTGGWRGITVIGTLQVSAGTFSNPPGTGGITYFSNISEPGKLLLEGGTIYTTQVKEADPTGRFSYIQTGGLLHINAVSDSRTQSAVFALPQSDYVFNMSGGKILIESVNQTATNGIDIGCDPGNCNVTGGDIELLIPTLGVSGQPEFEINSTAPFWDFTITESGNGGSQTVLLQDDLTIYNDLTIGANCELDADGNDLYIHGDLVFEDGAIYTHGNNTTTFSGAKNSAIIVGNTSGTAPLQFYNFETEKNLRSTSGIFWNVELESPGRTSGTVPLRITNDFLITRGSFSTGSFDVEMYGEAIEIVSGTITNDTNGKITLSGSSTQHTLKGAYGATDQSFGHIDLDNTNGVILLSDIKATDITLSAANTLFDLDIYNLEVTNSINNWSDTRYFSTAGNSSDGGLTVHFTLTGNYGSESLAATIPVGSPAGYSPAEILIDNYDFGGTSVSGSVQVTPVNSRHPGAPTGGGGSGSVAYYWVADETGFSSIPAGEVLYRFYLPSGITKGGSNRDHGLIGSNWYQSQNEGTNSTVEFQHTSFGFVDGEFTSGNTGQFGNRRTLYSRQSGDWHTKTTWSLDPHGGTQDPLGGGDNLPEATDICVIGDGHRINATTAGFTIGRLEFSHDTSVNHGFEDIPRVQIDGNFTFDFGKVVGTGMFTQWIGTTGNPTVTGDFGDFANEKYSWYLFVAQNDYITLPTTQSVFPNVATEGGNHLTFTHNIHINYNLNPRGTSILLLNNGTTGDIYVDGNCYIGDWGDAKIQFPSTGSERTLTIMGNLDFTSEAAGWSATNYRELEVLNTTPSNLEHNLIIGCDIIQGVGILDLSNTGVNANNVILTLYGEDDGNFTRTGTESTEFYRIELNKTTGKYFLFDDDFDLNGPTDSYPKALELISGDLQLDDGDIDIKLSSGGADFRIPSGTSLSIKGETGNPSYIRISGNNTGLYLDGTLTLDTNGYGYFNGGTNNYIQYSASGNAQIDIYQTELRVGSQIRRSLYTDQGILSFNQSDAASTVIIGENDAPEGSRAVFEVLNTGSEFNQVAGAEIRIVQAQTGPAFPSVYLDPGSSTLGEGSTITFGNSDTPAGQNMGIYSTIHLKNITVNNDGGNNPSLTMWTVPLTIENDLTIEGGCTFDANGLDLYLQGDLYNNGTFEANGNTTYMNGTDSQRIIGNTTFYNLTKSLVDTLSLAASGADITIENDLQILGGVLCDSTNTITVEGDLLHDGTHIFGGSGDGIHMNGSNDQQLSGNGMFGKLTISNDVTVPLGNDITITDTLKLNGGIFSIGKNMLSLGLNAGIEEAVAFSATNMIQTNISFTDKGVKKTLPSGASTFLYPIGSGGKYTPVECTITENDNSTGSLTVKAANERHPSIVENTESPDPEITDADNVLQYYWVLSASGLSGFEGITTMKYDPADVEVTPPYDVYDYITARLLSDGSGEWNKFDDITKFDETAGELIFEFTGNDNPEISGDYTAGVDGSTFNGAIPDEVPEYETNTSGYWKTDTIWTPNVSGGPRGAMATINAGHTVTSSANYISSYTTTINGTLKIDSTFGHRLGIVKGTGLIYLKRDAMPAGTYEEFFSATGGTIEFGGSVDYSMLSDYPQVNNLVLSGTGQRKQVDADLLVLGDLTVDGEAGLEYVNLYDREIEIRGDLTLGTGAFDAGTGAGARIVLSGTSPQTINGNFTGSSALNRLVVNNVNDITLNGNVDIDDQLTLTDGVIYSGANTLRIGLSGSISPASGSTASHIDGVLTKTITASGTVNFIFPVGDNGNPGNIEMRSLTGFSGSDDMSARYYFDNPTNASMDVTNTGSGIGTVSQSEYWHIQAPAGASGKLRITLDGSSDVANATTDLDSLRIVGWNGSQWVETGGTPTISGTATSGSVTATTDIDFDNYQYITLGITETIDIATASIISSDAEICEGETVDIIVSLTGTADWTVYYSDGSSPYSEAASSSPLTIPVSPLTTTTYTLDSVSDNNGTGILVGNTDVVVTVNPLPTVGLTNNTTGNEACEGDEVVFEASGGANYNFMVNDTSVQNSSSATYSTTSLAVGSNEVYVVVTNTHGCTDSSSVTTISIIEVPEPVISGDDVVCEESETIYSTPASVNSFSWTVTGGVIVDGAGTSTITVQWDTFTSDPEVTSTESGAVRVTESTGVCETTTPDYDITIYRKPETGPAYHISND